MKNKIKLTGIIAFVAVIGLTVAACGGGKIPKGKYVHTSGMYYEISGNKVTEWIDEGSIRNGTYVINDSGFFVFTVDTGRVYTESFARDGNKLIIGGTVYEKK